MNERQLPGLSLYLPSGSCQGSTLGCARPVLGVQRRHHYSGTYRPDNAHRWKCALRNSRRGIRPSRSSALGLAGASWVDVASSAAHATGSRRAAASSAAPFYFAGR